jgi:hypothetical protein
MKESLKDLVDRLLPDSVEDCPPPVFNFRGVPAPAIREYAPSIDIEINEKISSRRVSETRVGKAPDIPPKTPVGTSLVVGDYLDKFLSKEKEKEAIKNADSLFFINLSFTSSTQSSEVYADLKKLKDKSITIYGYFRSSIELGVSAITEKVALGKLYDAITKCGYARSTCFLHKIKKIR